MFGYGDVSRRGRVFHDPSPEELSSFRIIHVSYVDGTFCESILGTVPLASLGGRSPYEVVMGIKPRLPAALVAGQPVEPISIDEYVARLSRYFKETNSEVERVQREHAEASEPLGVGGWQRSLRR